MPQSAYDIGYEDGKNGRPRKDKDILASLAMDMAFPGLSGALDDFDYDEYNRGYDDGEEAADKD